jgi:hypothetical protein
MKSISVLLQLNLALVCTLSLLANPAAAQEKTRASANNAPPTAISVGVIAGKLIDVNGPITDAQVILQTFKDEKCVKLFSSKKYSEEEARKLAVCSHELPPIAPDNQGQYQLTNIPAGWYVLLVIWNMNEKPNTSVSMFQKGDFVISYSSAKDSSGKYDGMAQGKPFYFSGRENLVLDFDYRKGNISKSISME